MFIRDSAATLSREVTPEGFLRLRARIGRTGVHDYKAEELGLPEGFPPGATIRVLRPPEEVFDPASMASFGGKPVTDDHPPAMVDAGNWRRYAIGHAGDAIKAEGDHLAADLFIADAAAADRARQGAELSNGYHADFVFEPGTTLAGETYDAVQRNIRGNHIALVDAGRCGATCRVGDATVTDCACQEGSPMPAPTDGAGTAPSPLEETVRDGLHGAARRESLSPAPPDTSIRHTGRTDMAENTAVLDALVQERVAVIDAARRLIGPSFEAAGRPTPVIRRLVVVRHLGEEAVAARSDAYVAAAFDTLAALQPRHNPLAAQLSGAAPANREAALVARDLYLSHAWKGDQNGDR